MQLESPAVEAAGNDSFEDNRLHVPNVLKTFQPGSRAGLEAQPTRAAGEGFGRAAQNAQALLVKVQGGCSWFGFLHCQIVSSQGDELVSIEWQLCDKKDHRTEAEKSQTLWHAVMPAWHACECAGFFAAQPRLWQYRKMANLIDNSCSGLTVLYDGACPLCRREIAVYQGLQPIKAGQTVAFLDVSRSDSLLPPGGVRSDYLARFHVQRANGQVLSGAAAFVALWATLPGWRYLAMAAKLPGATPALELLYRAFLRIRPQMQGIAKAFEAPRVAQDLVGDLRSDQAGETGAVWIYRGLLAVSRDAGVREFAKRHLVTEQGHLDKINAVLPWPQRSRLLPGWRVAGFATGALPALFGPRAVYATIAAVETFVDQHYQHQIDKLANRPEHAQLLAMLIECQQDECEHRDEALGLQNQPPGRLLRAWCKLVGSGSSAAVGLARLI